MDLPEGFKGHQGLDGLLLGVSLVFFVKLGGFLWSLIDWRLVPDWTYEPIKAVWEGFLEGLVSVGRLLGSHVDFGGGGGATGAAAGSTGGAGGAGGAIGGIAPLGVSLLEPIAGLLGVPLYLFGALSASALEQILLVLGWWIAVLVPGWFWVGRPILLWWKDDGSAVNFEEEEGGT